jgi:hypothetical protein
VVKIFLILFVSLHPQLQLRSTQPNDLKEEEEGVTVPDEDSDDEE